ncbi:MAG: pyroglutamyl-peptidase I [Candidatus Heimdallarchaeota archaeon]
MKKVLLTGFGPFGQDEMNPALEVIKELDGEILTITNQATNEIKVKITTAELPVVFGKAISEFKKLVEKTKPDIILSIGQAAGRSVLSLERFGVNMNDTIYPDNEGNKPQDELIEESGPTAYFATIDLRKTLEALRKEGIPVLISNSAGTYVCNNIVYGSLHYLSTTKELSHIKYGFIHIPYLPTQAAEKQKPFPSLPLEIVKKAIKITIEVNL